jgi:hypothetical protein
MGDSGEGLVDAESRIQERMEELQRSREQAKKPAVANPDQLRKIESLTLARTGLSRQLEVATHPVRKSQLTDSIAELDRQIASLASSRT